MKEQSLTSTQKIQLPNKDLVGLKRSEEQKEVTKEKTKSTLNLSKPSGWIVLALLPTGLLELPTVGLYLGFTIIFSLVVDLINIF